MAQTLIQSLQSVRRRWKTLTIAFGAGIVLASAVLVILLTVGIDYLLNLPSLPRFIVILLALATIGYAAYKWIVRPSLMRLTISDVAGRLEHAFPQFDDRLRSTVDFVRSDLPGSEIMKERVVAETTNMATQVDLTRAVLLRPVLYALAAGVGALVLMGGLSMIDRDFTRIAFSHLIHPFTSQPWPKRVNIATDDLPTRVAEGQSIPVKIHLSKGFRPGATAIVHYRYDNGPEQQELMTLGNDREFTASLDARGQKVSVWMESGDDITQHSDIAILPRLEIGHIEAVVTPPKYANLPPVTLSLDGGPAVITVGSHVQMHILFNKPLDDSKQVTLEPIGKDAHLPAIQWTHGEMEGQQVTAQWTARDSFVFHIHATDTDGFTNNAIKDFEFVVRPDQMPTVQIDSPRGNQDFTPIAAFTLQASAEDDYGIKTAKLMVDRIGDKKHWDIDLNDVMRQGDRMGDRLNFRIEYPWDLSKLPDAALKPGDVLEYYVQVRDNYELPGENGSSQPITHDPVNSQHYRITIRSEAEMTQALVDKLQHIADKTEDVHKAQVLNQVETKQVQQETAAHPELSKAQHSALERLGSQQASVIAPQTKALSKEVSDVEKTLDQNKINAPDLKNLTHDVSSQLNQAAEEPMKNAADNLNHANQQSADPKDSPSQKQKATDQRNSDLNKSQQNQQAAADALQNAVEKMGAVGALSNAEKQFQKILDDQLKLDNKLHDIAKNTIGLKPDQISQKDKEGLKEVNKEQKDLAQQTAQATKNAQNAASKMQKSNPTASQALSQAAQQSQQSDISGNQSNAGDQAQQNQQSQAQSSQQQAELGLKQVLDTLKDAQKAELAKLKSKLDKAADELAKLVLRQAGHCVDDLVLQGPDKKDLITDDLLKTAGRDKGPVPPAALPQLTASQEQTERNTRDVTKLVDDLPGGAEISAMLIHASRRMSDAIIDLRDEKLADAYDPNMAEALRALQDASKKVAEQQAAVQKQQQNQQKEAIRQAYIRIKGEQDKLNDLTKNIDASPRQANGQFRREDQIRLNQQPDGALAVQGKLADQCKALDDDLKALDSVVYRWANDDIVKSMSEVKDDLAKPQTGVPTQSEQQRISDQLAAMIEDLKQTPPKKPEFEKDSGGGGGGKGSGKPKPKLPTEAELRLMRDLEIAIQKDTRTQDTLPQAKRDNQKLVDLGARQGSIRNLLSTLLQKAGAPALPPAPPPDYKLPEEANDPNVQDQQFDKALLQDKPDDVAKASDDLKLIGDRMAIVPKRLDKLDPGQTTQVIEEHIVKGLTELVKMAANQQQSPSKSASSGQPKPGQPQPGQGQPGNSQANGQAQGQSKLSQSSSPASSDQGSSGDENQATLKNIQNGPGGWGETSPRIRAAVTEGSHDTVIQKYQQLVSDYYRALAIKSTEDKK